MSALLRRLAAFLLLLLLTAAAPVHADGSAEFADPLAGESSRSKWDDPAGTGWLSDGPSYCYGRQAGIGLRKVSASGPTTGIRRTFDTPENIREVALVCTASAGTAFTGKDLPLQITLFPADTSRPPFVQTRSFALTDKQPTARFSFLSPEAFPVTAIRLESLSSDDIIIVSEIAWRADTLPISYKINAFPEAFCGTPYRVSVVGLTGGSGDYTVEVDAFGGHYTLEQPPWSFPTLDLTAPDIPGDYTVAFSVTDSEGKTCVRMHTVTVTEDRSPPPPTASDITGTGFRLSWDPYPGDVKEYEVSLCAEGLPDYASLPLPPADAWTAVDGYSIASFSLAPYVGALRLGGVSVTFTPPWQSDGTQPEYRYGNRPWTPADLTIPDVSVLFSTGRDPVPDTFDIRIPSHLPLPRGNIGFTFLPSADSTRTVGPETTELLYSGLPRGLKFRIGFTVRCRNPLPDKPLLNFRAPDSRVQLSPLTSFTNVRLSPDGSFVRLVWPGPLSDSADCTGTVTFTARLAAGTPAPPPLRFTGTAYVRGTNPVKTYKLYAFTNLGPTPLTPAEAGYRVTAVNSKGTVVSPWKFTPTRSSDDAGRTYTLQPGETLVLCAGKNMPPTLDGHPLARPGEPSALSVGPGATLTLTLNGTPVGPPLPLTKDTLVRALPGETTLSTLPLTAPADTAPLFEPIPPAPDPTLQPLVTYTVPNTQPVLDIPFTPILRQAQTLAGRHNLPLTEIFAETTIREGSHTAPSTFFTLWTPSPLRPGFLLRLR